MPNDEDMVFDTLNLSNHVSQTTYYLQVALSTHTRIDVVKLVFSSLCIFFRESGRDLIVRQAFKGAGVKLVEHLPILNVVVLILIEFLGGLNTSFQHGGPNAKVLLIQIAQKIWVRGCMISWAWRKWVLLQDSGFLVFLPLLTLLTDKIVQGSSVITTFFCKVRITTNLAEVIINRFAVTGNPNLSWGEIECGEVRRNTTGKNPLELIVDDLSSHINHLDVLHVV